MTLVIMAAGMGSRFGGLKQIEPVNENGEFIIDYSVYDAVKSGVTKVIFVIKRENYEIFKETIGKRIEKHVNVEYAFQDLIDLPEGYTLPEGRVKPWGTAHAVLCAKNHVNEPFILINSDDFYGRESFELAADYIKNKLDDKNYAMVGYKLKNTVTENGSVTRGVCGVENGKISTITECKIVDENNSFTLYPLNEEEPIKASGEETVSMNMFIFNLSIFDKLERDFKTFLDKYINDIKAEFQLPACVFRAVRAKELDVNVLKTNAKWLGITFKEDKDDVVNKIKKLHDEKIYNEKLWD